VIGCGGTSKTSATETVWNDDPDETDGEGTGGGYSTFFPVQPWQAGAPTGWVEWCQIWLRTLIRIRATLYGSTAHRSSVRAGPARSCRFTLVYLLRLEPNLVSSRPMTSTQELRHNCVGEPTLLQRNHARGNGFYRAGPGPNPCCGLGSPIGTKLPSLFVTAATPNARAVAARKGSASAKSYARRAGASK
jgi:kumamolisin